MIKAILVFNNHGKPRLSKFYQYFVSFELPINGNNVIVSYLNEKI